MIRPRTPADLPALAAALRAVHEAQGYPSLWPLFLSSLSGMASGCQGKAHKDPEAT